MAVYAKNIVKQAQSWVGLKESDKSHKEILDVYNNHKPLARGYKMKVTDAWCACFVSACAIKCGATHLIPTEVGCGKMIDLFKKKGIWVEADSYKPNPGDIIFYDWEDSGKGDNTGGANHVGIVETEPKKDGSFYVIEGNISDKVGRRSMKVNGKYIRGYGVPKYDIEQVAVAAPTKSIDAIAKEVIAGKWGNHEDRRNRLTAAGYDAAAVQKRVNEMLKKETSTFAVGDKVKLASNAKYYNDKPIPQWVKNSVLYCREIVGDRVVISTLKRGAVTGAVNKKYITKK